jgi:hypothetical protein
MVTGARISDNFQFRDAVARCGKLNEAPERGRFCRAAFPRDLAAPKKGRVPTNAQEDDHVFEIPPAEQCRSFSRHRYTLPKPHAPRLQRSLGAELSNLLVSLAGVY